MYISVRHCQQEASALMAASCGRDVRRNTNRLKQARAVLALARQGKQAIKTIKTENHTIEAIQDSSAIKQ